MRAIFSAALAAFASINVQQAEATTAYHTLKDTHEHGEWQDEDEERPEQCYGIALSDASDFGPYQAGALIGLLEHQEVTGEHYHIVTGVALGAINAYVLATHKPDEIQDTIKMLRSFWIELASMSPYDSWTGGFIYGFFFEKGIYDLRPMAEYLNDQFSERTVHRHLNIAVTNVLNGQFSIFDESLPTQDLIRILAASVTFSGISPAVEYDSQIYFSGNTVYENDVLSVINHCESLGYKEEDIVIDTILSGQREVSHFDSKKANAFSVLKRSSEVFKYYQHMHGIMRAKDGHRNVNFRYVVAPSFNMPSKIVPLQYSVPETTSLIEHGQKDAQRTIYNLLYKTDAEITERIHSPMELRFYNKERQQKHEDRMREVFTKFMDREKAKVFEAKERAKAEKEAANQQTSHHNSSGSDTIDNFNN